MNPEKAGLAAYTSSIFTFLAGLSLNDYAMLTGILTSLFLAGWKIYVDCKHLAYEKQSLMQQNKTFTREEK